MSPNFVHASTRRELLGGAGVLFAWPFLPKLARAEGRDPRMLTIILRGALDGLAAVAPVGDPDWVKLRGDKALLLDGKPAALPLDSFFALNPAMPNLHRLYKTGQAAFVHAAATPYRERSHFDGQDVLESGLPNPGRADSGWLNRALGGLEAEARARRDGRAFAVGPVTPLVVRGPAPVMSWTPQRIQPASEDTMTRLIDLYHHTDMELARAIEGAQGSRNARARGRRSDGNGADRRPHAAGGIPRAGARVLRRCGRHRGEIPRACRRAAHRRARLQRLGHAYRRGRGLRPARDLARRARRRHRGGRERTWARPGARRW